MLISHRRSKWMLVLILLTATPFPMQHSQADDTIQQGQWRTKEEVLEMVNPLLDPELVEKRKSTPIAVEFCVRSSSLQTLLGIGKEKLGLCNGPIEIGSGKISIQRACTTGLGKSAQKIEGTYTPVRVERIREDVTDTPKGQLHMKTKAMLERIGECKP